MTSEGLIRPLPPSRAGSLEVARDLSISDVRDEDGSIIVVSRYGDSVWDFSPMTENYSLPVGRLRLNFDVSLPDGRSLLDPAHAMLLADVKKFVFLHRVAPCQRGRGKVETIVNSCRNDLWPIVRFMVRSGYESFAEISDSAGISRLIPYAKSHQSETPGLRAYWILATVMALYERGFLPSHPWPTKTAAMLAEYKHPVTGTRTPELPGDVAPQLYQAAAGLVEADGDRIAKAFAAAEEAKRRAKAKGWGDCHASTMAGREARRFGFKNGFELRDAVFRLRTACCTVIGMITGSHLSEILGLEAGCIVRKRSWSGRERLRIQGRLFKWVRRQAGREEDWTATADVERAVKIVERLSEPLRIRLLRQIAEMKAKREWVKDDARRAALTVQIVRARRQVPKLFLSRKLDSGLIEVVSLMQAQNMLQEFVKYFGIRNCDGEFFPVISRQFRQTKVAFVMRHPQGDVQQLRKDCKHKRITQTLSYGKGTIGTRQIRDVDHTWDGIERRPGERDR